jgi:hypothetical protein
MEQQSRFRARRPLPSFGGFEEPELPEVEQTASNSMLAQASAPDDMPFLLPVDDFPKDYCVSVDEIRLLLFENGIEKSKDTIQRYCREGRLDAVKLGLLRRYFATPLSVGCLLEYLQTDAVEVETLELDAAASTGMQVHEGASGDEVSNVQPHAAAEPSKSAPEPDPHEAASTRTQAHAAERSDDMVDFLKGQINVKDEQIKVKDTQIAAMLERDRETNFLIRELQTQLSNTFRLVAGSREDVSRESVQYGKPVYADHQTQDSVENPLGQ